MKTKVKFLVTIALIFGCSISQCFAYDYVFAVKDNSERFYSETTVDVTTIKAASPIYQSFGTISTPIAEYPYEETLKNNISYDKYTEKDDVLKSDGSIGTLKISEIDLSVKVYDGTTSGSLKKGIGHFIGTSYWDGNIALAGHNRGVNSNFGKLKKLEKGDIITYTTKLGKRRYKVFYTGQIGVSDLSRLEGSSENMITLITCVEDQPMIRLCIQARQTD